MIKMSKPNVYSISFPDQNKYNKFKTILNKTVSFIMQEKLKKGDIDAKTTICEAIEEISEFYYNNKLRSINNNKNDRSKTKD